jgi:DNA polymerase III alpha subunit (gram-positive type)
MITYPQEYWLIIDIGKTRTLDKSDYNYYTELHHIIPRSQGGTNDKTNLVLLTAVEHYNAHKILALANTQINSIYYAWHIMAYNPSKNNSRIYEIQAEEYAQLQEMQSKLQSGVKHSADRKLKNSIAIQNKWKIPVYRNAIIKQLKLNNTGVKNGMYGKSHTDEAKKAISLKNSGYVHTTEFCEFQSNKLKLQWKSSEFRQKLIDMNTGKHNKQSKRVCIDGIIYDSASDAFRAISPPYKLVAFCKRIRSTTEKYKEWYYL